VRVDPRLGPTNSVGAKIDFAVKRDAAATAIIHWLPNITYKDPRWLQGMFPIGSNYMGMMVHPLADPETYVTRLIFSRSRPQARNVQIVERRPLADLARTYQQRAAATAVLASYRYTAGMITVLYDEGGVHYREKLMAVIEDTGQAGLGMWTNHDTLAVRAPAAEFDTLTPLFEMIQSSLTGNPEWVAGEQRGAAQRAANALRTQRYVQDVQRQIVENRRRTNAAIRHSIWLNLTDQEEYVNPHTGQVETGSSHWKNRWVNAQGDMICSDDPSYDPRRDPHVRQSGFERSPVRQR
jgi:hypothetical protein